MRGRPRKSRPGDVEPPISKRPPLPPPLTQDSSRPAHRPSNLLPTLRTRKEDQRAFCDYKGRRIYFGYSGTPEAEKAYRSFVAQILLASDSRSGQDRLAAGGITVASDIMRGYLIHCTGAYRKRGKPTGHVTQITYAAEYLKASGVGATLVTDFGPNALRAFRDWLAADRHQRWNATTIRQFVKLVRAGFRWAAGRQLIPSTIADALVYVEPIRRGQIIAGQQVRPARRRQSVPAEILDATCAKLTAHQALMVRVHALAAMRPSELCAMQRSHVQVRAFGTQTIGLYLVPSDADKTTQTSAEESAQQRIIILGPRAMALLADRLAECAPTDHVFSPMVSLAQRSIGKISRRSAARASDHYTEATYRAFIKRACMRAFPHPDLAKVPRRSRTIEQRREMAAWMRQHLWTPYQLRHTGASAMVDALPLTTVKDLLGHADIATTQGYIHTPLSKMIDAALQVG